MANEPTADIQKFLPEHFLNVLGENIPRIIAALNDNVYETEELIQAAIDQLFLSTASGKYLIRLGEEQGFIMPQNSGLDIRSYKILVPVMVSAPKQVRVSVNDLIQAFYQNDRVKANISSSVLGPYSINDGDDLIVETESGIATVTITSDLVSNLNEISAQEISAIINNSQDSYKSEIFTDRNSGLSGVKISTNTTGSGAFIRVRGGTLQNILKFPNIIDTKNATGTTWNVTKTSIYTDELQLTWDGVGVNADLFNASEGDFVSIAGLVDGVEDFSKLNGSYEIIDVGYDYFVIRNTSFNVLSSSFTQNLDNNIVITSQDKTLITDNDEFAITSETKANTITLTVPAVPPLARRFLFGSAHLHGEFYNVLDFTRNSIKFEVSTNQQFPDGDNNFIIKNNFARFDFAKNFKTTTNNGNTTEPTFTIDTTLEDHLVFPHTVPTLISSDNPIYGEPGSDEIIITFPFDHGLHIGWSITLSGSTASGNLTLPDLNQELQVFKVIDRNTVSVKIKDTSGDPVIFSGESFSGFDVYRHSVAQSDSSDFYMDFGTPAAALASGLEAGMKFKFDPNAGTDNNIYYAGRLKYGNHFVRSVNGSIVSFTSGLGIGPQGLIITSGEGFRASNFGGSAVNYFLDKNTDNNIEKVMEDLRVNFIGYSTPLNPNYLGPYVFDPSGEKTNITVSGLKLLSGEEILKGESRTSITVDESVLTGDFPESGKIVLGYGTSSQEGPIDYLSFIQNDNGSSQLLIDPSYRFEKSHSVESLIQFVRNETPHSPNIDGSDYQFYITGTNEARNTLFSFVNLLVAAGIFVESDVVLPDLRYVDSAINPFI